MYKKSYPDFDQEIADAILEEIRTSTKSIKKICKGNPNFPGDSTVFCWLHSNKDFASDYARAKEQQTENLVSEINDLEDELQEKLLDKTIDNKTKNALVQAYKLQIDDRKWIVSKLKSKKYGDKIDTNVSINEDSLAAIQKIFPGKVI